MTNHLKLRGSLEPLLKGASLSHSVRVHVMCVVPCILLNLGHGIPTLCRAKSRSPGCPCHPQHSKPWALPCDLNFHVHHHVRQDRNLSEHQSHTGSTIFNVLNWKSTSCLQEYFAFMYVCPQCPWAPEDGIRSPTTGTTDSCEPSCGCQKFIPVPLEE